VICVLHQCCLRRALLRPARCTADFDRSREKISAGHNLPVADEGLEAGRAALARGAWEEARAAFEGALAGGEDAAALEGLAWAAWWLDDIDACFALRERAYRAHRRTGDACGAARVVFEFVLMLYWYISFNTVH